MKIVVLSDSHDNIPNLRESVLISNDLGAAVLIHCGDLISPFMLDELALFNGASHLVYGNNVGDQHLISQACGTRFTTINHHGVLGFLEVDGLKIAFTHYPQMARGLLLQGTYDVVCCGHNHRYQVEVHGDSLLINPGELLGKDSQPSFCVLDCGSKEVERIDVGRAFFG